MSVPARLRQGLDLLCKATGDPKVCGVSMAVETLVGYPDPQDPTPPPWAARGEACGERPSKESEVDVRREIQNGDPGDSGRRYGGSDSGELLAKYGKGSYDGSSRCGAGTGIAGS